MEKNIEWFKEEIPKLRGYAVIIDGEGGEWEPVTTVSMEDIYELINQLDKPEVLSSDWIKHNQLVWRGVNGAEHYVPSRKLYGKLVPKQELPVIPYFIEEHIQTSLNYSEENTVVGKIKNHMLPRIDETETDSRVLKFFNTTENIDLVALAMITENYVIEEEQRYYLKIGNLYLAEPLGDMTSDIVRMTRDRGVAYQFTDEKSIATHLDKFEGAEAVKVEEMEE